MARGRFQVTRAGVGSFRISPDSFIQISREKYQPLGSDFFLGGKSESGDPDGTHQEMCISSRVFMTSRQLEAEANSITYATSEIESPPTEKFVDASPDTAPESSERTAPYEAFHIKGLGADFSPKWNDDVRLRDSIYLELDLWNSLDVRSAAIVVGPVGGNGAGTIPSEDGERSDFQDGEESLLGWPSFPSSYLFNLEINDEGDLIDLLNENEEASFSSQRVQKKAYILLGYLTKDPLVLGSSLTVVDEEGDTFTLITCIDSNLSIQHGLSNETPVLNIVPSFGAGQVTSNYYT